MIVDQDIYPLVTTVAACITAIAALWAILMMARQLRAAYRPELALSRALIRSTIVKGETPPWLWIESPNSEPDFVPRSRHGLCIEVRNIGLGTANNVSIKWSFPLKRVVKEVNEIAGTGGVHTYSRIFGRLNVKLNEERHLSLCRGGLIGEPQ